MSLHTPASFRSDTKMTLTELDTYSSASMSTGVIHRQDTRPTPHPPRDDNLSVRLTTPMYIGVSDSSVCAPPSSSRPAAGAILHSPPLTVCSAERERESMKWRDGSGSDK
ncbi:hypothetical protein WMY93_031200 [Mugilogobius chulae]|uniref:Uncharacterized protein n=1 Tax=Mugilogobius chulae TaxID=88201 RepID=A0AAW0MN25_9GOBI